MAKAAKKSKKDEQESAIVTFFKVRDLKKKPYKTSALPNSSNRLGMKGVSFRNDTYQARVSIKGVRYYGGNHKTAEEAFKAVQRIRAEIIPDAPKLVAVKTSPRRKKS